MYTRSISNDTFSMTFSTLNPISRSRHFSTLNISEATGDRTIFTIERQHEVRMRSVEW